MTRMKPETAGWEKVGRKHYRNTERGVEVRYDCNRWLWEVIGGSNCSLFYTTRTVAQYYAVR